MTSADALNPALLRAKGLSMNDSDFLKRTSELERLCQWVDEARDEDGVLAALDAISAYLTNPSDRVRRSYRSSRCARMRPQVLTSSVKGDVVG